MQDFKIDISSKVDWKSKNLKGTPTEEKLFKNLRKSAKEGIAESIPEIAPLNKELSELYSLEPYLIRGADRIKNSDTMGIIPSLSSAGNRAIAKLGIGVNEYRNKPISALLDNKPTRPLITNILGTVGDVNYDNDNLLPFRKLVKLYE